MTVFYKKTFKTGNLKGITVPVSVSFGSKLGARGFARLLEANPHCTDSITNDEWFATDIEVGLL